jgi:hypothetical protein
VLERAAVEDRREVGEGAVRLGDRDAVEDRGVVGRQRAAAVELDAGASLAPRVAGDRDVDGAGALGEPPRGGGGMWLSTPAVASVAAIQRPWRVMTRWPTA